MYKYYPLIVDKNEDDPEDDEWYIWDTEDGSCKFGSYCNYETANKRLEEVEEMRAYNVKMGYAEYATFD